MLPLPTLLSHPPGAGAPLLLPTLAPLRRNPNRPILRSFGRDARLCIRRSGRDPDRNASDDDSDGRFFDLRRWDVPWDWKVTLFVMMPYLLSILFTGVVISSGTGEHPFFDNMLPQHLSDDEMAVRFFFNNLLKEMVKLSILYALVSPYQPLPEDILSFRWNRPLNLQNGWIVWAAGGLLVASCSVFLLRSLLLDSSARDVQNETESLTQFLPVIGSSVISTGCLISVLGIMAPICEEILYRGFLLASLTKWLPLHSSIIMSSAVFTLAHQSPGKSLEIFIFGLVLGLVYSQTRNLLSPVLMHALWNLGVLMLTFLLSQNSEIHRIL